MAQKDDDLMYEASTRADRPVLNTSDTPEFINLATHYKDKSSKLKDYESLQFTEGSLDFRNRFEDDAIVSGQVQPTVKPGQLQTGRVAVMNYKPTEDGIPPYRDIPGTYASVGDTVVTRPKKPEHYVTVPVSWAYIYNPLVLILISLLLILLIAVEIIGVIYVF